MRNSLVLRAARGACLAALPILASAAGPGQEPLKVAFVYVGSTTETGWTATHDQARKAVEAAFGNRVQVSVVQGVPESAASEQTFRDLVAKGNRLIFGTTFGYAESIQRVAAQFKGVAFEHASGFKQAPNLRTYDARTYEAAYLAGVLAGGVTKTGALGVVASVPIPQVVRDIDSFTLGARSVNPRITTRVVWVGEWFNRAKEAEAAEALISSGADVLMQTTDSTAPLEVAQKRGKRAFGYDADMSASGLRSHLGSIAQNWAPYYIEAVRAALDNRWAGGTNSWLGLKESAVDLVSVATDVPAEARARVDAARAAIKQGRLAIWQGPIETNDGELVLATGRAADDRFLESVNFYVDGVVGNVPGRQAKVIEMAPRALASEAYDLLRSIARVDDRYGGFKAMCESDLEMALQNDRQGAWRSAAAHCTSHALSSCNSSSAPKDRCRRLKNTRMARD